MLEYKNNRLCFDNVAVNDIEAKVVNGLFIFNPYSFLKTLFAASYNLFVKIILLLQVGKNPIFKKYLSIASFCVNKNKTPFYIYSETKLIENFNTLNNLLGTSLNNICNFVICFSVKSCSNINILKILQKHGSGADVVSGGELMRAVKAGVDVNKIVFAGVGKTKQEIKLALELGILQLNAESFEEILDINTVAESLNVTANVCVRLNPDVDAKTHGNITTGKKDNKFGISITESYEKLQQILSSCKNINFVGISTHIGSQITERKPLEEVFYKLADAFLYFTKLGYNLKTIDFGGGLGIVYDNETVLPPYEYTSSMALAMQKIQQNLPSNTKMPMVVIEPGRFIAANTGILVSKVVRFKQNQVKNFLIVDAAMNDLIRPALYGAHHKMYPTYINANEQQIELDIVGPVCESSCCFAKSQKYNAKFNAGDTVVFANAGAYGYSMSSRYNTRPMLAEYILTKDKQIKQINTGDSYFGIFAPE